MRCYERSCDVLKTHSDEVASKLASSYFERIMPQFLAAVTTMVSSVVPYLNYS